MPYGSTSEAPDSPSLQVSLPSTFLFPLPSSLFPLPSSLSFPFLTLLTLLFSVQHSSRGETSDEELEQIIQDPIDNALQTCFNQVIRPVAYFLCFLGWRPFPFVSSNLHSFPLRFLDFLYPLFVCCFLAFSYIFGLYYAIRIERNALISEFVIQAIVSFALWIYGMWFFRREEGKAFEELSALIETVYIYSGSSSLSRQDRLTENLTNYLIYAGLYLLFYLFFALWEGITLANQLTDAAQVNTLQLVLTIIVTSIGYVAEHAIYAATIIIYWIICRLHMRHLDGIRDRLMKRSINLSKACRDIAIVKKLISDNNRGWAVAVSFLSFSLVLESVFIHIRFFEVCFACLSS